MPPFSLHVAPSLNPVFPPSPSRSTFWEKNYAQVLHLHPSFSFMLRPAPEMAPYMLVEYGACDTQSLLPALLFPSPNALPPAPRSHADYAHSVKVSLEGLDEAAIEKKVSNAARQTSCSLVASHFHLCFPARSQMEEAVTVGEQMPKSVFQSGPVLQPSVIE
jgi:hypothetical protein